MYMNKVCPTQRLQTVFLTCRTCERSTTNGICWWLPFTAVELLVGWWWWRAVGVADCCVWLFCGLLAIRWLFWARTECGMCVAAADEGCCWWWKSLCLSLVSLYDDWYWLLFCIYWDLLFLGLNKEYIMTSYENIGGLLGQYMLSP